MEKWDLYTKYREKKKDVPLRKKTPVILLFIFVLVISLISLFPNSRFHLIGSNLTGTIAITVNGQPIEPYHITCVTDTEREEKLTIRQRKTSTDIKCTAGTYNGYVFDYDADIGEETKHFRFMVMKTHNFGPRVNFAYQMRLDQEDDEWIAYVWLDNKGAEGRMQRIPLSEDETAYIQMGP